MLVTYWFFAICLETGFCLSAVMKSFMGNSQLELLQFVVGRFQMSTNPSKSLL